jgi:AsmA family
VRFLRSRRGLALVALLILVLLYVVRPGAAGLKARVAKSISLAMGRQVEIGDMHMHLLPRPGFDLDNFVVYDDPAFGAEPMLRASEVTATLRFATLLHGRLEVSQLSLIEPSVNLVRDNEAHWNVANLLQRTAQVSVAPTSRGVAGSKPAFPYIEAKRGRINFKLGAIKKPYSLTDADFGFWQESDNAWGMRLRARPVRTDLNLSDTGLISVEGTWQRAKNLQETPLRFDLQWSGGQLGQLTKLASGEDRGWRGGLAMTVALTGSPADLSVTATSSIQDFHRYDIIEGDAVRLNAHCLAHYSSGDGMWREIICGAPVGDGTLALQGKASADGGGCDLILNAEQIPAQSLVALARRSKKNLPDDLMASGKLDAKFSVAGESWKSLRWEGTGETREVRLKSSSNGTDFALGKIPFVLTDAEGGSHARKKGTSAKSIGTEPSIEIGPVNLALGRPIPLMVRGSLRKTAYTLTVSGEGQAKRLLQTARTLGIPTFQPKADGVVNLNLTVAGVWQGFAPPSITGTARLSNVNAELRGVNAPVELAAAELVLRDEEIKAQNLKVSVGDMKWAGSLTLPRHCLSWSSCPITFDLHADSLNTDQLNNLLNPHPPKTPWYSMLSSTQALGPSPLLSMRASGKISADRLVARKLDARHVAANISLQDGKLTASDVRADLFGGKHNGEWHADFTAKPPKYSGSGNLEHVALAQFASSMQNEWITGTVDGTYSLAFIGYSAAELTSSANGEAQFVMQDGILPRMVLPGGGPLRVHRFTGILSLSDGVFRIEEGKLIAPTGTYEVSGNASGAKGLSLAIAHDGVPKFDVTGTLREPHVNSSSRPETRAELKP